MENEVVGNAHLESLPVPEHIAGPLNGDPYALVDRTLFGALKPNCNENIKMQHSSATPTSFDLTKGITDLDNLLSDLGFLTSSCKTDHGAAIIKRDENSNFSCLPSNDGVDTITTRLPTINVVGVESSKSKAEFNEAAATKSSNEANCVNASEVRVKPRLPARTSSFGAVSRHHKGSLGRSESEDGRSTSGSSQSSRANNYHENVGSDDVFNYDGPLSPTVSDMLSELSNSPLAADSRNNWPTKRLRNFSTKYDNVVEHSSDCDKESAGEFRQGRVKDHVKQFNRILSSPDPSKVGTGVPMPGLVQGIDFEDKISKFNYRSLAPGQCGPIPEHLYMAGSPPKRIVYEIEEDEVPAVEAENLFIPSYADRPAAYYLKEREKARQQQGMKLSNGHVPVDEFVPDGHSVNTSCEISDGEREGRARADSAYGGSMRSSSVASTSVTSNAAAVAKTRNENCKSSGRGSHASSVTSLDDEDSSGYARIEDIQPTKEELQNSSSPVVMEAESELIKEQEVIAVSHTVPHKGFQDRMKNRVPEIKSKKDLSLAVYQTNYLPGLTNGQPTVLSSSQIDLEDESFQSETDGRQDNPKLVNGQCSPVPAASPPQDRSHLVLESRDLTSKAGSEGSLGPGIHIVESPPSPCCSAKSDSSSITLSPTRKTLRHRLRRSNSSTSSLSSSELFPEVLRYPHVKFDKDTLKFWYKPKITRDEAMAILKDKSPGTFVVRDSQSYEGAFGLAVKVATPPLGVIQQAGGDISKINMENELIRHFLIEPCKQGVRLKGSNNEPAFPSLVALVFQHSVTKMALPIELKLPTEDIENLDEVDGPSGLTEQQVLQKGAACNLVYLSCIDVEGLTGDGAVKYSINKTLSTNYHVKSTVVTIKVNQDGITLTDDERRLFFRKHYSIKDVLFCVMDPRGRRFNLHDVIPETTHQAPCFGVVVSKPQRPLEHECIVFAEMEPSQPASAVIDFIQRAMKMVKQ